MWRIVTLACASACAPGLEETRVGRFRMLEGTVSVGRLGRASVDVVPEAGETKLLASAVPIDPGDRTYVRALELPTAAPGYDAFEEIAGNRKRSNAGYVGPIATVNWPIARTDMRLLPGEPHRIVFGLVDPSLRLSPGWLRVSVLLTSDADPDRGVLNVDLVHLGAVAGDADLRRAADGAVQHWRALYARVGIELVVRERVHGGERIAPPLGAEDRELWQWIATSGPPDSLRVVLAPDRPGEDASVLGVAGDVPAPWIPSPRTGIRVVPSRICGVDGVCDAQETFLFGEVLAHEAGHHLGLFHPVEVGWDVFDALPDTVECGSQFGCEQGLGENLMFPYTLCSGITCVAQEQITRQQGHVLNGYLGVE